MKNKDDRDGSELLYSWQAMHNTYSFEGDSGVRKLGELCQALDPENYSNIGDFLADNPGACEAIVDFIGEWLDNNSEWRDSLRREIGPTDAQRNELKQIVGVCPEITDPEDLANSLADGDGDLQDKNGEILEWVIEECESLMKQPEGGDSPCEGTYLRSE